MADMKWYIVGVIFFFAAVACFSRWLEARSLHREIFVETPFVALASPSKTNAFDRRIDHAVREASRGFRMCTGCHFTNRARADACVVCGSTLCDGQGDAEKEVPSIHLLTRRQRRARTRKDWSRQVNEDGVVVWHRTKADESTRYHFYVMVVACEGVAQQSEHEQSNQATEDGHKPIVHLSDAQNEPVLDSTVNNTGASDTFSIVIEAPVTDPTPPSINEVATELRAVTIELNCTVETTSEGATVAESTYFTRLCMTSFLPQDTKDVIANSSSDFPTKFAQFVTATSTVFLEAASNQVGTTKSTRLNIDRSQLLSDAIRAIGTLTPTQARGPIRVDFNGEKGIDAGGVYREFLLLLNEQIVSPSAGIFTCVDEQDQTFYLNRYSRQVLGENHLVHFFVAGRLLGRTLLDGNATGFHLCLPLLKIILGLPVSVPDLEYYDSEAFKHLSWLLKNDGAGALGLNFTMAEKLPDGSVQVVELVPGGTDIDVTDANKHDYADHKLKYLLFDSVHEQLVVFLKGMYEIVPPHVLSLFDAEELDYVLAGSDEIDVDDWERNSQFSINLRLHPALKNFWKVVHELSVEQRRRLLQFATGSTRVPPGGFGALASFDNRQCAFTLHGFAVWKTCGYIRSHACFNRLDLPLHPDLKTMREAVTAAISVDPLGFTSN